MYSGISIWFRSCCRRSVLLVISLVGFVFILSYELNNLGRIAGDATVTLVSGGVKQMIDLALGDKVSTYYVINMWIYLIVVFESVQLQTFSGYLGDHFPYPIFFSKSRSLKCLGHAWGFALKS